VKVDILRQALPDLEELHPVVDRLIARSEPDPTRTWSASGAVATVDDRVVRPELLEEELPTLLAEAGRRLERVYELVREAVAALGDGRGQDAAERFLEAAALDEEGERHRHAGAWADAARRAAEQAGAGAVAARAERRMARAAWRRGALDEAYGLYEDAFGAARRGGDDRGAAEGAIGAGNVLEEQGRWSEAEAWYRRALERLDEVDEAASERWHALLDLHIVLRSRGELEESLPWLERAESAARAAGDEGAAPYLENARGQLAMGAGDPASAESHFRSALAVARSPRARITIGVNLGECLLAQSRWLEAAETVREAELEAIRARLVARLPEVYRLLGRIAWATGNEEAFVLFERSLALVEERGLPALERAVTLDVYARFEQERGNEAAGAELARRAGEIRERLGIRHARHRWMDYYGPADDSGVRDANDTKRDGRDD